MLAMMKAESRPVAAPGLPTTIPPKSTSGGDKDRNGAWLTSLPWSVMGKEFEYCATPLVVEMTSELVLTPGLTELKEAPLASLIVVCVRFHTTGKEKVAPLARLPWGREALLVWKVASPRVIPLILVIGIRAVHSTLSVFVVPIVTSPKSTGLVQFNGMETGEPMQITAALLFVT